MFTVKQLSKLAGITPRTLHYYDEIGLLRPARMGENGYRYYDENPWYGYSRSCCIASWICRLMPSGKSWDAVILMC